MVVISSTVARDLTGRFQARCGCCAATAASLSAHLVYNQTILTKSTVSKPFSGSVLYAPLPPLRPNLRSFARARPCTFDLSC